MLIELLKEFEKTGNVGIINLIYPRDEPIYLLNSFTWEARIDI